MHTMNSNTVNLDDDDDDDDDSDDDESFCSVYLSLSDILVNTCTMFCAAEPPSFINTLPSVTKIAESQTAVLVCQVFGAPKPVITWKKDEENVMIGGRVRQENKENSGNLHISVSHKNGLTPVSS